jgi:hypothetical protein
MSSTKKKINANRENALASSGPKTAKGKNNSRRNAVKHSFFSQELVLSDAEKVEFQALRRALQEQLQPTTALQSIGMEEIVCCCWRCKLAVRQEMRRLSALFDAPRDQEVQPEKPTAPSAMARWYAADRQELRRVISFLECFKQDFEKSGRVRDEWKQQLDGTFGVEFYESLMNWPTISLDTILLANHLDMHKKTFKSGDSSGDDKKLPEVVLDPLQSLHMVGKLIDQKLQHLYELSRSWEQRASGYAGSQNAATVDFAPRYFTTASRDLHRAVEWYAHLKERNL